MEVLLFRIGTCRLGLMCSEVSQLLHLPALTVVPETPRAILGFFRIADQIVPVVRADVLLNLPPVALRRNSPLVLLRQLPPMALLVDEVEDVIQIEPRQLAPLDYGDSLHGCAAASLEAPGGRACLLSAARLLGFEERQRLEELQARAADRMVSFQ